MQMQAHPDSQERRQATLTLALSAFSGLTGLLLAGCGSAPRAPQAGPGRAPRHIPSALSSEQRHDIAIHALGLVGTPYRYGGNTPDSGFDCSGLIGYVYRTRAGISPPRTVAELSGFGEPVAVSEVNTGDLVIFGRGRPNHAGIYVGELRFVHAPSTGGLVRMDRLDGQYWSRQPTSARRL